MAQAVVPAAAAAKPVRGAVVFVGGFGVTSAAGYPVRAKEEIWLDVTEDAKAYAITASGTAEVRVLEAGG